MKGRIEIGAAVLDYEHAIIGIGRLKHGREYRSTGRDAEQHKGIDAVGAQDHLEIGAREGAHAVLDHDDISLLRSHGGMDLAAAPSKNA